ncbi:hypothetical protein IJ21_27550 [Paenibacillus sp. 32O-W]|jgi:hypothetical protein|uniref:Bacterial Pleckstrin homology domain-containing protein n=1 Tax=Paenibacillus cisolokensis TaxID=1658519 RepID=A0ABQ4N3J3_9BACL|nr:MULTISPECIES: hypothetical protein [Paenibacillus]ALS28151.1 hypothetical protein IJ21_27550 [Paenibacillus sp. 32O-W]GIQ62726.1 hypothetical protein PACILC2_12940 [Paenibacillus cisolokensis]
MTWLAAQPYYKVQREVSGLEQKTVVHDRTMYLYPDKIATERRQFPIGDVFDMSYRKMGGEGGMLYFHTKQGVYSYMVKDDPRNFIGAFKELVAGK